MKMGRKRSFFLARTCESFSFLLRSKQQGGATVELALLLPFILAGGMLCVDLFRIGVERTRMEQLAGAASITLSVQQKLGKTGLDGLYDTLFQVEGLKDVRQIHQMIVSNVTLPSRRVWWSVSRGAEGICEEQAQEGFYTGELPVDLNAPATNGDPNSDAESVIVVRLCRSLDDVSMEYLGLPERLNVVSINRTLSANVDLDEALLAQAVGAIVQEKAKR